MTRQIAIAGLSFLFVAWPAGARATVADSLLAAWSLHTRGDSLAAATRLDSIGVYWQGDGTHEAAATAESLVTRGLALRARLVGRESLPVAESLDHLAGLRFNRGDYDGALAPRTQSLAIRTRLLPADDRLVGESERDLGSNWAAVGRYAEARPLLESAQAKLAPTAVPGDQAYINLLTTLGEFRRIENRYDEAESCLVRAARLARAGLPPGDPFIAYPLNNLAGVYRDQGRFDEAEPLLRESYAIHAAAMPADPLAFADATLNRAELARLQGRVAEAETLYVRALATAEQALGAQDPTLVWFLNQYGVLERERSRFDHATQLSRRSLAILEAAGGDDPLRAQVELDLAELLRLQDRGREAEGHAVRAVTLREQTFGPDHPEVALALIVQIRCRGTGAATATDSLLARAVAILDRAPAYPEGRIDALALRAGRRAARGEQRAAIADLEAAISIVEDLRPRRGGDDVRAGFVGGHARLYEDLIHLQASRGNPAAAFATVERGRARVFRDQWQAARVDWSAEVPAATRAPLDVRMQEARLQIDSYQNQMARWAAQPGVASAERSQRLRQASAERDRWVLELDRAEDELRRASPQWRAVAAATDAPATVREVARELAPAGGLVLSYFLGEQTSWLFAVADTATAPRCFRLDVDADAVAILGGRAGALRARDAARIVAALELGASPALVQRRGIGGVRATTPKKPGGTKEAQLHALWRVLVPAPLRAAVVAAPAVVVIPDGALHALPFEALVIESGATAPAGRDWLEAGPVIRYAASVTTLLQLERVASRANDAAANPGQIVSVAAPHFAGARGALAGRTLEALPGTAREASAVRDAFAPSPVTTLLGDEATESRLRAEIPNCRYLHVATHGIVDRDRDALLAGLALTPGRMQSGGVSPHEDDGFLQLFEIYRLRVQSDLVVLSACETSAGALVAGEGMFALSRGFLTAGARRVVASLWPVEDESTAALVAALFRRIATAERDGKEIDLAVALRDAKREVRGREPWRQPFYWAGFVLSGAR